MLHFLLSTFMFETSCIDTPLQEYGMDHSELGNPDYMDHLDHFLCKSHGYTKANKYSYL